jgi:hypothetical protein
LQQRVQKGQKAHRDLKEILVQTVQFLAQKVHRVQLGLMVLMVLKAHREFKVFRENLVNRESRVFKENQVPMVQMELMV